MNFSDKICLTCLCESQDGHDLSKFILENHKICDILYKIVPMLLENQKFPLPELICTKCLKELIICYKFQTKCLDSLQYLYKLWTKNRWEQPNAYTNELDTCDKLGEQDRIECKEQFIIQYFLEENEEIKRIETGAQNKTGPDGIISNEENTEQLVETSIDSGGEESSGMEIYENSSVNGEDTNLKSRKRCQANKSESQLTLHVKTHDTAIDELKEHVAVLDDLLQCKQCEVLVKHQKDLEIHMVKKHRESLMYQCDKCGESFALEKQYKYHYSKHLGVRTFICPHCPKAFGKKSSLNQHLISHSVETPYLCTLCGKAFRRAGGLQQHINRHSNEKPIKCSICGESFKCTSDRCIHMLTHNTEKPYQCKICGSRFTRSDTLLHHKIIHTGKKPFKCDYCERGFNSMTNMKRHTRTHTGEKPYKCQYCDKAFGQSNDMKKHMVRYHTKSLSC